MELDLSQIAAVDRFYAGLMLHSASQIGSGKDAAAETSLGGKLLYTGELDAVSSALVVAANIAGSASLAASADKAIQRQAIRDGMVDFLVTTLDEALRILKNQVRKRETVAVCVAQPSEQVEREMVEIGVQPDLLPSALSDASAHAVFMRQGALKVVPAPVPESQSLLTWSIAADPAVWLPKLDAIARECLDRAELSALRWLRLAPRYLGRTAQNLRLLRCNRDSAARFIQQAGEQVAQGAIGVPIEIHLTTGGQSETHRFLPDGTKIPE